MKKFSETSLCNIFAESEVKLFQPVEACSQWTEVWEALAIFQIELSWDFSE